MTSGIHRLRTSTFPRRPPGAMLIAMPRRWEPICAGPAQLVRPVGLDATGQAGPTRGQARGKAWRSTTRGFYVPTSTDSGVPEQRIVEQSMPLGGAGAATAWASLRMHRAGFFDGLDRDGVTLLPVPLISPDRQLRPLPGRLVCQDRLDRVGARRPARNPLHRGTASDVRRDASSGLAQRRNSPRHGRRGRTHLRQADADLSCDQTQLERRATGRRRARTGRRAKPLTRSRRGCV